MLISTSKMFIFAANTKTASTSVESALEKHSEFRLDGAPRLKHLPLVEAKDEAPNAFHDYELDDFFIFGIMRNPIDWIQSWYRYRLGNNVRNRLPSGMTFKEFWEKKDWNILRKDGKKYLQKDIFLRPNGDVLADVIVPYETLDDHLGPIMSLLQIEQPLPKSNTSRVKKITEPLAQGLLDELKLFYAEDFALYENLEEINKAGMEKLRRMVA